MGILRLESKVKSHEYVWGEWKQGVAVYGSTDTLAETALGTSARVGKPDL